MICTRCNAPHTQEHPLVSTQHGLLCPACVLVVDAWQSDNCGYPMDPLSTYSAYDEPVKTHFMGDAFDHIAKEILARMTAVEEDRKRRIGE